MLLDSLSSTKFKVGRVKLPRMVVNIAEGYHSCQTGPTRSMCAPSSPIMNARFAGVSARVYVRVTPNMKVLSSDTSTVTMQVLRIVNYEKRDADPDATWARKEGIHKRPSAVCGSHGSCPRQGIPGRRYEPCAPLKFTAAPLAIWRS